jgi:HEAT repeat protein
VREAAAYVLSLSPEPRSQELLIQALLSDSEATVRFAAAENLTRTLSGIVVDALTAAAAKDSESKVREMALKALCGIEDSWPKALAARLLGQSVWRDESPIVRRAAARILAQAALPEAESALICGLLNDESEHVREACALSLKGLRSTASCQALSTALADPHGLVRIAALEGLCEIGTELAQKAIQNHYQVEQSWEIRRSLIRLLGSNRSIKSQELLYQAFQDPHPLVRTEATKALQGLKDSSIVEKLVADLHSTKSESRVRALEALRGSDDGFTVHRLQGILQSNNPSDRILALRALGGTHTQSARELIGGALRDEDSHVRSAALRALRDIQ